MLRIRMLIFALLLLAPLAYAEAGLTVEWSIVAYNLYTGEVCLENTDSLGRFDTIIMEYSYNDHTGGSPSPRDLILQEQEGSIYCAELEPTYWAYGDSLDNAKITIKDRRNSIYQDDKWKADVPIELNSLNHSFHDKERTFEIQLNKGWNLVSIPLIPVNNLVGFVFGEIDYSALFYYDSGWKVPTEINTSMGYWINANDRCNLTVKGFRQDSPLVDVKEGWNLIGYPYLEERKISEIFSNAMVRSYNNSLWHSYNPNKPASNLETFTPGLGYWVYER